MKILDSINDKRERERDWDLTREGAKGGHAGKNKGREGKRRKEPKVNKINNKARERRWSPQKADA